MRITSKVLQDRVDLLNKMLNRPETPYTRLESGELRSNAGHFILDSNIGGYQLECMAEGGGVYIVLQRGTARELCYGLVGMLAGIREHREKMANLF